MRVEKAEKQRPFQTEGLSFHHVPMCNFATPSCSGPVLASLFHGWRVRRLSSSHQLPTPSDTVWQLIFSALYSHSRLPLNSLEPGDAATSWALLDSAIHIVCGVARCLSPEQLSTPTSQLQFHDFKIKAQAQASSQVIRKDCFFCHIWRLHWTRL